MLVVMVAIKPILYKTDELNETEIFRYIRFVNYITIAVLFASAGLLKNGVFIATYNQCAPERKYIFAGQDPFSRTLYNEFIEIAKLMQKRASCTTFTAIFLWLMLEWTINFTRS
ncbi:hypothetical protein [Enterobacter genomosp. O]|uniref:hypothetical protein n=1 Tax=Enterobacter genomosp. O TaxID=2364150 RepID=UPI001041CABE|nr:hypothetical protein [Enterobacter genomosp. O]